MCKHWFLINCNSAEFKKISKYIDPKNILRHTGDDISIYKEYDIPDEKMPYRDVLKNEMEMFHSCDKIRLLTDDKVLCAMWRKR